LIEIILLLVALGLSIKPLGIYIAGAMEGKRTFLSPLAGPAERALYRACGIDPAGEMSWRGYAGAVLLFSLLGFALLYCMLLAQGFLPLNPQALPGLRADTAFNVAISFITNTDWQSYSGESSLSYFSQMAGLTVQNFFCAGVGMAVAVAVFRAFARRQAATIGNFWVDLTRACLYVLLPLALVLAVVLASQGVVQHFGAYTTVHTLEGSDQTIALGPVASQAAIKMLGSNGGGYFNANAAHPFENPTPLANFLQTLAILLIPSALVYAFGVMVGDRRQGWALLAACALLFLPLMGVAVWQEARPNPQLEGIGVDQSAGNMEGKETRFGVALSALWATATTATSNGSTNSAHDSYLPLPGLVQLAMMQFGEVVFGGVGSGMYGLLLFVIITVFLGGLMVGRTPEYMGKKLGAFEIKMASVAIIAPCAVTLVGTAAALMLDAGRAGLANPGAHGLSEALYAFTSAANNNGSAFAGLNADSLFYNTWLGVVMFVGRFFVIIPVLAIAGSLAARNTVPPSLGTMPTHTPLFVLMLVGVIAIVGLLTYAPALALGPVAEHLQLFAGGGA